MIDERNFKVLWRYGYPEKDEAYRVIREGFSDMQGVTAYYDRDEKLWYIVQSRVLANTDEK